MMDSLPLPVFPLRGVLLLPHGRLPLNIFEPRYLAMVEDALKADRLIGMIQPSNQPNDQTEPPALYPIGCAGRIVAFEESADGCYLITLVGISRFRVAEEIAVERGYRRVMPDYAAFAHDVDEQECPGFARARMMELLQAYFQRQGLSADWAAIEHAPEERLVTCLSMICPFTPGEKQALIEAPTLADRAEVLLKLLEMAAAEPEGGHQRQ